MTIDYLLEHPFVAVLVILTAVLGVGRLTRLVTYDAYPPAAWLRTWWISRVTKGNGWAKLADCGWCAAPYLMLPCMAWGVFTSFHWTWWAFWGWMALSYVASMIFARDEPADSE